ncbi:MAG: hypothetical protein AAGG69_10835 [Pseudomonadota bacterium]
MQTNFFVDFTAFGALGIFAGIDFMIAFSLATFLAMATRYFTVLPARIFARRDDTKKGDHSALPAFWDREDKKRRD